MELADQALEQWGIRGASLTSVAQAPTLVIRVDPGPFTLRIRPRSEVADEVVASQLAWLQALSAEGLVTVPEPIALPTGEPFAFVADRRCVLLRWIEGESLLVLEPVDAASAVGRTIARMHVQARSWSPPAGFTCPTYELQVPASGVLPLSEAQLGFLERAREDVLGAMAAVGRGPDSYGVVHGDLNFRNFVLRDGEACPFDFDEFGLGYFLSDLAEPLRVTCGRDDYPELRAALLAGYREEAELSRADEDRLDLFIVGTFLSALCWAAHPECAPRREELAGWIPSWLELIARLSRRALPD